jgi:ribose-phosphate pyrophosphokinase
MIQINGECLIPRYFPDGPLRLDCGDPDGDVTVEWRFENNEEMVTLYFLVSHLRETLGKDRITLRLPYVPNARMDRVKANSEVFTLKYFCRFINDLKFDKVIVRDVHSNVSLALLDRSEREDIQAKVHALADQLLTDGRDILFFPDEGSSKRYADYFQRKYLFGIKKRDWATGTILGLDVIGEVPEGPFNVLIVDDICSYGGTFYHSAKKLRELGARKIWLYVTHCENSVLKGELPASGLIDRIYTTNSIYTAEHPLIEMI